MLLNTFFFFKQKTAYEMRISDWSSDVCSSDLDHGAVVAFCKAQTIGLVVIGPEAPLVDGLADSLRAADVPVFGPGQQAAQLEGSKGFRKDLCGQAGIPTAGYVRAKSEAESRAAVVDVALPVVIMAEGLAAGRGVESGRANV